MQLAKSGGARSIPTSVIPTRAIPTPRLDQSRQLKESGQLAH